MKKDNKKLRISIIVIISILIIAALAFTLYYIFKFNKDNAKNEPSNIVSTSVSDNNEEANNNNYTTNTSKLNYSENNISISGNFLKEFDLALVIKNNNKTDVKNVTIEAIYLDYNNREISKSTKVIPYIANESEFGLVFNDAIITSPKVNFKITVGETVNSKDNTIKLIAVSNSNKDDTNKLLTLTLKSTNSSKLKNIKTITYFYKDNNIIDYWEDTEPYIYTNDSYSIKLTYPVDNTFDNYKLIVNEITK